MNVGSLCKREVVLISERDSVLTAARRMRDDHVGTLIVVDDLESRRPVGIVTDRDIVVSGVAQAYDELGTLEIGDVMSRELISAREDEPLEDVLKRMRRQGIRRIPVVRPNGSLVGILALDDVLEFFAEQLEDVAGLVFREQQIEQTMRP